ncbi:MAG TPA: ISKra4 family transposase, partial [Bryobacteraceae bacterium]|nr:ISKra4 family transposase [Bryobacteraceae bacterium]
IEAGCKTVIGSRLKQSGMFWTVRGANAIIALRCCCLSGKFAGYWKQRAA